MQELKVKKKEFYKKTAFSEINVSMKPEKAAEIRLYGLRG